MDRKFLAASVHSLTGTHDATSWNGDVDFMEKSNVLYRKGSIKVSRHSVHNQ